MDNNFGKSVDEQIKEYAERAKRNEGRDRIRTTDSGATEYNFSVGIPETSLVFIDGEEDEVIGAATAFDTVAESEAEDENPVFQFADVAKDETVAELKLRGAEDEEFDIPESFVMSEEYSEPADFDMAPLIWKTYVPRFTEVTERTYRLRDENAPAFAKTAEETPEDMPTVKAEVVDGGVAEDPDTTELEGNSTDAVLVNVDGNEDALPKDTINVFKFGGKEKVPEAAPTEEELERRDITELTGHIWQDKPEPVAEAEPEEEIYAPIATGAEEDREETPEDEPALTETAEPIPEDDDELPECERPLGWDTDILKINASDTGEYNHHSMRESFKDKFLDSLLSIKIRMVVSAVLAVIALLFENLSLFGVDALSLIGLGEYPNTHPLLGGALILCMLAIALPEILSSIKHLAHGRVHPEISLALSAILLLVYNSVVASLLVTEYLCFGFIYGTMVFFAIFANHSLQKANFEVFKRISDKGVKTVVDNRLTRTLERENIALDGAVDEYKSRCARRFKTNFVGGFSSSSAKGAENRKNNLLTLAFCLGIALVVGVIMYFIGEGVLSALASASLVVMLALPAFSFASHKLTYLFMQNDVISRGSAFMGERAVMDYAGVDCIVFEDGEIIGGDDVSFKSISLSDRQGDLRFAIRQMASLFSSIGGPLFELFASSLGASFSAARDIEIEEDGISGRIDGVRVMAGSFDYMRRHGVKVVAERQSFAGSMRTMYGAEDGVLFAKFNIQYNFSEEFARSLSEMRECGITALVYTRDPNLDTELMRFLTGGADLIRVMKKTTALPETDKVYNRLNCTLVEFSPSADTVSSCVLAKRYKHVTDNMALTELSAAAVGAVLASALAAFNMAIPVICPIVGLWQIGWYVTMAIISKKSFPTRKHEKD